MINVYHSSTQLPDGRLSLSVDPGAWTNLIGPNLARKLAKSALQHGMRPRQAEMAEPLAIQGVGNGAPSCRYKIEVPIAVPHADGSSRHHHASSRHDGSLPSDQRVLEVVARP